MIPDDELLDLVERLARIAAAMAHDTALHDQAFELLTDIQALQLARSKVERRLF